MSLFEQIMMNPSTKCHMPSFKVIGLTVLEKIFEGFYHIWAWPPSWSCDPDPWNKLSFPHPTEAPDESVQLVQQFQRRRRLKMVDGRRMTEPYHTICSPGAFGSGEL